MKADTLEKGLRSLMRCYTTRGFKVVVMLVDVQFKTLKDRNKLGTVVNIVSRGEHVKQIERFRRVIEERTRCYFDMVPFGSLPRMMIIQLVAMVTFYVNSFVWLRGASKELPPLSITEGLTLDYHLHFRITCG